MNVEKAKLIVELTKAKVDILKLKADSYTWSCHVDGNTQSQLMATLDEINATLDELRGETKK